MNMKKISALAAGVALACSIAAPASAVTLVAGDLKITFDAFDAGTVNYGNTDGIKCTDALGCDLASPLINHAPNAVGSEDTWGIFSVKSISRLSNGASIYTIGDGGKFLTGLFYGLTDEKVVVKDIDGVTTTQTFANGGKLDMYETNVNYDSSFGPAGRIGTNGYQGITDVPGTLALSAKFSPEANIQQPGYGYFSSFANDTISGHGQGYLDVTAGTLKTLFDTNSQIDLAGNAHDLFLNVTYAASETNAGWTVDASGNVRGKVPEPASLALFGLALAGLAGVRRRKSK